MKEAIISNDKTINSHFSENKEVFICLFPFYKQVFADHYNWEANLKLTFSLLSTVSWHKLSKDIGFNSLNRLAKGILELEDPFKTELKEYCEWKKINFPDYAADRIPEVLIIPIIRYQIKKGFSSIRTKKLNIFPGSKNTEVQFKAKDEFEVYYEIQDEKCLLTEDEIEILLPDYDCPYVIIAGKKENCFELMKFCDFEYFQTKPETKFDWWNQ